MSALRRLVVVDPALNNLAALLQALLNQPMVDVLQLSPTQDPLAQISAQLATQSYAALDIFSPGTPAAVSLAGLMLNTGNLPTYSTSLAQIGAQLNGGSIFLYGSQVASGTEGQAFIDALALDTGVVVAASTGLSGGSMTALAGTALDWSLEASSFGAVTALPSLIPVGYVGLLDVNNTPTAQIPGGDWTHPLIKNISSAGHVSDQIALLDINGDGQLDLLGVAVVGADSGHPAQWQRVITVAAGHGDGTFDTPVNIALPDQLTQIRLADVNADGRADVVATGWSDWNQPTLNILQGSTGTGFDAAVVTPTGLIADTLAVHDLNGDGRPEVILGGTDPVSMNTVLQVLSLDDRGGVATTVTLPTDHFHASELAVGDMDGDGRVEIIALGEDFLTQRSSIRIIAQDGAGHASLLGSVDVPAAAEAIGTLAVADINGDGCADLLLPGLASSTGLSSLTVLPGHPSGQISGVVGTAVTSQLGTSFWPGALSTADLTGDGRADVVLAGYDSTLNQAVTLLLSGQTDGHMTLLTSTVQQAQTDGISAVTMADLNHDGQNEIVVAGNSLAITGGTQQYSINRAAPYAGLEDSVQTLVLRGSDLDGSIDHFNLSVLPSHGTLYLDAALTQKISSTVAIAAPQNSATLYFKPDANWNGETALSFVAVDNRHAASSPATLPISVTAVNDAPQALSPFSGQAASLFTVQQYLGYSSNLLQNLVNYASSHLASNTTQTDLIDYSDTGSGGQLGTSRPWPAALTQGFTGSNSINDNFFVRATANFSVSSADTYSFRDISDDGSFLLIDGQLVINDPTYHAQTPMTGSITLSPGQHSLELYFFEASGAGILELSAKSSTGSYQLMNAGGTLFSSAEASAAEDTPLTLQLRGSDVDGTVAGFRISQQPAHGTLYADAALTQVVGSDTLLAAQNNAATLYFRPEADWNGATRLAFVAVDDQGSTSPVGADLLIRITPQNDAPVLSGPAAVLVPVFQDSARSVSTAQLLAGWSDVDAGDSLSVVNLGADHGSVVANADGSFTITNAAGYTGPMLLSYGVSDGHTVVAASQSYTVQSSWVTSDVSTTLPGSMLNLQLTGTAAINGTGNAADNVLIGNAANNVLYGGAGQDRLSGGDGNDSLNGGTGADRLIGGAGDDAYTVDNPDDLVIEAPDEGIDRISSSVSYTLGANVEKLYLSGTAAINATGNELANILVGNTAANVLDGGLGNDSLNGGTGADTLIGGTGDDAYTVDNPDDLVVEAPDEGIDRISSSVSYTLGVHVEKLYLSGSTAIDATGNELANTLVGNAAANVLDGGLGNDSLNGGTGADTLIGGLGDDWYTVDNPDDLIVEAVGEGSDGVSSSISYTLGANVEKLYLSGTATINATGNELANLLVGNTAANVLDGGLGNDTLNGGTGADTLIGGAGNDRLSGGADADCFQLGNGGLSASNNMDTITDFVSGLDQLWLDTAVLLGFGLHGQALQASMLRSGAGFTTAADADDHLIYNTTTGALYYDTDGAGGSGTVQIAKLNAGTVLVAADVWLA